MEYNVNPNIKIPMMAVILTAAFGLCLALVPTYLTTVPSYYFHLPAVLVFVVCILILSRFVLTTYSYQLYDSPNTMSQYPKLNVYRIKKSGSNMVYCIPFNNIISIKLKTEKEKSTVKCENLCASMVPQQAYRVRYLCGDKEEEILIECNRAFAGEIEKRIALWSEVSLVAND